jgi:hypothetical protein
MFARKDYKTDFCNLQTTQLLQQQTFTKEIVWSHAPEIFNRHGHNHVVKESRKGKMSAHKRKADQVASAWNAFALRTVEPLSVHTMI